mgnify:CR=1 FL=1
MPGLRVNVCDQDSVWLLSLTEVKSPVLIRCDYAPLGERNMIAVAKRLEHQDHLSPVVFRRPRFIGDSARPGRLSLKQHVLLRKPRRDLIEYLGEKLLKREPVYFLVPGISAVAKRPSRRTEEPEINGDALERI